MRAATLVMALMITACAESHQRGDDVMLDASIAVADASALDAAGVDGGRVDAGRVDAGPGPRCGPNRCRSGEVCCNEGCGICAFADECGEIACPGVP